MGTGYRWVDKFFQICCGRNATIAFFLEEPTFNSFENDGIYTPASSTCKIAAAYGKQKAWEV
jgi:hypothetical protein